jgi:hypothetical protein
MQGHGPAHWVTSSALLAEIRHEPPHPAIVQVADTAEEGKTSPLPTVKAMMP